MIGHRQVEYIFSFGTSIWNVEQFKKSESIGWRRYVYRCCLPCETPVIYQPFVTKHKICNMLAYFYFGFSCLNANWRRNRSRLESDPFRIVLFLGSSIVMISNFMYMSHIIRPLSALILYWQVVIVMTFHHPSVRSDALHQNRDDFLLDRSNPSRSLSFHRSNHVFLYFYF